MVTADGPPEPRRPRRIVLATNHLMVGGAEAQLVRLATRLVARGDEVGILSLLPTWAYADEVAALGIPVAHAPNRSRLRALSYIAFANRVLRQWQPDIVLSFLYQANVVSRVGGRLARVPVVVSSVRSERLGGRHRELVLRATDRLATLTTTNSAIVAESLIHRRIVPRGRLQVVPNGLDPSIFRRAATERHRVRADLDVGPSTFVWLTVARLEPQKDLPTLLKAFSRYRQERRGRPDAVLWIAGGGRLLAELDAQASDLGLGAAVRFLGIRNDVPELLAACDALVQSSAWEGLPNVVMEAMAAGRPVVATRVGGTAELVDDGQTGLLVQPQDPIALASGMVRLASLPPEERTAYGERGRAFVAQHHTFDTVAAAWLALLDRLAGTIDEPAQARARTPMGPTAAPGDNAPVPGRLRLPDAVRGETAASEFDGPWEPGS
jgi:glycosyltransferase involved in cell wall biosynthesis